MNDKLIARVPPPERKDLCPRGKDCSSSIRAKLKVSTCAARRLWDPLANEPGIVPRNKKEGEDADSRNGDEHRTTPAPLAVLNRGAFTLELRIAHLEIADPCKVRPRLPRRRQSDSHSPVALRHASGSQALRLNGMPVATNGCHTVSPTSSGPLRSIAGPAWADRRCRRRAPLRTRCFRPGPPPQTGRTAADRPPRSDSRRR